MDEAFATQVASIPNTYIFHLDNGKVALVQSPVGKFHEAVYAIFNWLKENHPDISIIESYPFRPNNAGWQIIHTNGELFVELKIN